MDSRLQQVKADPNFSDDLSSLDRAVTDIKFKDIVVLTPDRYAPNLIHVFKKACYHPGIFRTGDTFKCYRQLKVTQSGEVEIYDGMHRVDENLNLYLFSENAIKLYEQIKALGFFHSFEDCRRKLFTILEGACITPRIIFNSECPGLRYGQHCETLDLFYKSDVVGDMLIDGRRQHVVQAAYILSINRAGDLSYQLRFHARPDSYGCAFYSSIDQVHDPKVREFHQQFIAPLLDHGLAPTKLSLRTS